MRTIIGTLLGALLSACAAAPPPPASAQGAVAAAPHEALPAPAADTAAPALAPAPAAPVPEAAPPEQAPAEPEAEGRPARSPVEVLTGADTAFQINYSGSTPAEAVHRACAEKGGEDNEAIAECSQVARAAFKPDVVRFKKDGGQWRCSVYKRDNSRLDEVYSARVELSESAPNRVQLKFTGSEKGLRPWLKGKREGTLSVPNDYSFVLVDPELGRLTYEAKVGLVGS